MADRGRTEDNEDIFFRVYLLCWKTTKFEIMISNTFGNMYEEGVVDPAKVTRSGYKTQPLLV
jgi:chaperonin GroEL (HSP60 family)